MSHPVTTSQPSVSVPEGVSGLIMAAKLGTYRKDAQQDTCTVFAAALYDVLSALGMPCRMVTAIKRDGHAWAHSLVEIGGRLFDSKGEFSTEIYRQRARIHPQVMLSISYSADSRADCYEEEFEELYVFYRQRLLAAATIMLGNPSEHASNGSRSRNPS